MCNNTKNENPHVWLFLIILHYCRREGQKAVVGVNIWTRRVRIRKMTRRRQLWKGNSSVPRERTLWENKGTERTFCKFNFAIPAPRVVTLDLEVWEGAHL